VGIVLLLVSGWLGGMLSYRYGVRVADETTQVSIPAKKTTCSG
jgi:uncharacterized membrane protein